MNITILTNLLIKVFLLIALGYIAKKSRIITEDLENGLTNILMKIVMPFSILTSASTKLSGQLLKNIGIISLLAAIYYIFSIIVIRFFSNKFTTSQNKKKIFLMLAVFANTGFLGFPLMSELYGSEGLLYAVVYNLFYQIFFFTYGITLLSGEEKLNIGNIVKNPVNIALMITLFIVICPFSLPSVLNDTFSTISAMMVPVSMMLVGCSLSNIKVQSILKDIPSYGVSALRLIIFPLIMFTVTKALNLEPVIGIAATVMTALPSGTLNVVVARQYNCDFDFSARAVVQSMILSAITIPLTISLCNLWFG